MVYNFIFFKIADYYLRHTLPQGWTCPYFVLDAVKAATVYNSAPQFLKGIAAEYECLVAATNTPSAGALTYYLKNLSICRNTVPRRFKTEYQKKKRGLSNPSSRSSSAQVATPPRSPAASGFAPPAGSTSIRRVAILGCTPKALRHAAQYMYHNIPVLIIPCSLRHMGMREASFWAGQPCSPGSPMSAQSPTHISTDDVDISENTQGVLRYLEGFLAEMVMSRAGKTQCRSAQSDRNIEKYCNRDVAEALRERENYNDSFEDTTRGLRLDISEESIPQRKRPFTVEEVFRVQNALKLCRIMSVEDDQLLLVQDVDLIVCYRGSFVSRQESVKQSLSHYFNENDELAYSGVLRFLFTRLDGRAKNNCTFLFDNYENLCLARKQLSEFRHDRLFMMFSYLSQLSPTPAEERVTLLEVGAVGHSFSVAAMDALQCLFRRMGNLIVLFTRALPQVKSCPCDHSPKGKVGSKDNLSLPKEAPLADSQRDLKQESSLSERRDVEAPQLDASTFVVHCEEDKSSVMEHYSFSGLRLFATGFFQLLLLLEKSIHTIDTIEKSLLSFGFKQGPFLTCQILGVQNVWYEICLQHFDPTVAYLNDAHEEDKCKCPLGVCEHVASCQ
ncbi:hypothetical protein ADEAN_000899200 [Angomonas deanei]|uniref:Uncharacterized protein n=1 Tax=Angomonas deanei TaxID=59799 RepID=A0A7G2CNT9_9TRYP|nr:hypothetical protein ADEAN_000899200 [Angomonas deanei]